MRATDGRWQLPLGLIVSPLAETGREVPTVTLGGAGIVRCRRCRAYMNPFMRWSDGGRCAALRCDSQLAINTHHGAQRSD